MHRVLRTHMTVMLGDADGMWGVRGSSGSLRRFARGMFLERWSSGQAKGVDVSTSSLPRVYGYAGTRSRAVDGAREPGEGASACHRARKRIAPVYHTKGCWQARPRDCV